MDTLTRSDSKYYSQYRHNSFSNSTLGMDINSTSTSVALQIKENKISKRVNARLQLAAALIEADNEEVEKSKVKLASESVIFSPYRDQTQITNDHRLGEAKPAARLDLEGRPVIDFLGVKLPAEKRLARSAERSEDATVGVIQRAMSPPTQPRTTHSSGRASSEWPSRPGSGIQFPSSRPVSVVSTFSRRNSGQLEEKGHEDTEDAALSEWGVEKFLSSEAKDRIEKGRRSRATSTIERPQSALSNSSMGRAHSEIGTEASAIPANDLSISKLDLMARIKMYREGQKQASDELQEQDIEQDVLQKEKPVIGVLNEDRLRGHLEALAKIEGSNIGTVSQVRNSIIGGRKSADLERAQSNSGIVGDSWSEHGDEVNEGVVQEDYPANHQSEEHRTKLSAVPIECEHASSRSPKQDYEQHELGMAGIGSFSCSPHSRSHSRASVSHTPGYSPNAEAQELGAAARFGEESGSNFYQAPPRSRSPVAFKSFEGQSTLNVGNVRRQSVTYLATPSALVGGGRTSDTSPRRLSMLNPAFSPRLKPTQDSLLASLDPYFDMAGSNFSPYPTLKSLDTSYDALTAPNVSRRNSEQFSTSMHGLSTRQLQEMAKQNPFPASFGMSKDYQLHAGLPDEDAELLKGEQEIYQAEEIKNPETVSPARQSEQSVIQTLPVPPFESTPTGDATRNEKETLPDGEDAATHPIEAFVGANQEPDLSSARWGRKKRKSLLATKIHLRKRTLSLPLRNNVAAHEAFLEMENDDDVDDEYTSPATKGPLRPRGLENRLPAKLEMPKPLQGTSLAPRRKLVGEETTKMNNTNAKVKNKIRVPEGFVLHNRLETVSMKTLKVHGASGAKPFFMSPVGKQKHDRMISEFLTSQSAQRMIPIPLAAPPGIGRRAAMNTTALFRNQLVQHEEEKEGWGWEATNPIGTELVKVEDEDEAGGELHADLTIKKEISKAKKLAKKKQREKQKRKEARRIRRKKREIAKSKNLSFKEAGVQELSPDEDMDLSETSSDESFEDESDLDTISWNSEDEARWVDERVPAGTLYGKSLLDVVDERKKKVTSKARQYGQVRTEELLGDNQSISGTTMGGEALSFRDNPVGFNDTRERMEAAFGPDTLWAKEMAKRQLEEAQEAKEKEFREMAHAKLEAEEAAKRDAKKSKVKRGKSKLTEEKLTASAAIKPSTIKEQERLEKEQSIEEPVQPSQSPVEAPKINLELPSDSHSSHNVSSLSGSAAKWLESDDEEASSNDSEAQASRQRLGLQQSRVIRSLGTDGMKMTNFAFDDESESSSEEEDHVPLSRLRASRIPIAFPTTTTTTTLPDDSSDEEVPLSQLVLDRKKKTQSLGTLDFNFTMGDSTIPQVASLGKRKSQVALSSPTSDEDDVPIGLRLVDAQATLHQISLQRNKEGNDDIDDDDDDDRPLGVAHPQAAIINEQANVIKQLQTELLWKQQQHPFQPSLSAYGYPSSHMSLLPSTSFVSPYPAPPTSMVMFPTINPDQKQVSSIANWAAEVSPNVREENM